MADRALPGLGRGLDAGKRSILAVTVAMSELLLSGCTTTTDHHYLFSGRAR